MIKSTSNRGRPRKQGIDRFNIASDLTDHRKFIKFRRTLGVSPRDAFAMLVRFFNYVAINHAMQPKINLEDADVIAEYVWYEGEAKSLINALFDAGILDPDYSVHEWFEHQPLADKIAHDRDYSREKSPKKAISVTENGIKIREDNINTIPPAPFPTVTNECCSETDSRLPVASPNQRGGIHSVRNVLASFNGETVSNRGTKSEATQLCDDFCDRYGYKDSQTRAALHHRIQICGAAHGLDCIRRMIGEIQEDHRVEEPIKVLHTKLNHAINMARETA